MMSTSHITHIVSKAIMASNKYKSSFTTMINLDKSSFTMIKVALLQ